MVGVRRETIVNLENGRYNPSLKLAMDIAKVFVKPVEEIFFLRKMKKNKHINAMRARPVMLSGSFMFSLCVCAFWKIKRLKK